MNSTPIRVRVHDLPPINLTNSTVCRLLPAGSVAAPLSSPSPTCLDGIPPFCSFPCAPFRIRSGSSNQERAALRDQLQRERLEQQAEKEQELEKQRQKRENSLDAPLLAGTVATSVTPNSIDLMWGLEYVEL